MSNYIFAIVDIRVIDKTLTHIKEKEGIVNAGKLFREDNSSDMIWFLPSKKVNEKTIIEEIESMSGVISVIPKVEWELKGEHRKT